MRTRFARVWLLVVLLTAHLMAGGAGAVLAQDDVRTAVGTFTDTSDVSARFVAIIAPTGRTIVYFCSDNDAWNQQFSRWFVGQRDVNRLTAVADDGTELTAFISNNQMVGTLGARGWAGTVTARNTAGRYQVRNGSEVHVVLVAPDESWLGSTWSTITRRLIRTWDPETSAVERLSGDVVRARPDSGSDYVELRQIVPDATGAWTNAPWRQ